MSSKKATNVTAITAAPVVVHPDPSPVAVQASWEALSKLGDDDLKKLAMAISAERKQRRLAKRSEASAAFPEGTQVRIDNPKNKPLHGTVGSVVFCTGRSAVVQFQDRKVSLTTKNLRRVEA